MGIASQMFVLFPYPAIVRFLFYHLQASEKTDEDYQMDDVVITSAARKQSEAELEDRDHARAILGIVTLLNLLFNKVRK